MSQEAERVSGRPKYEVKGDGGSENIITGTRS